MDQPNQLLMSLYETEDVYLQKLAGKSALRPISMAALNWSWAEHRQAEAEEQRQQAEALNEIAHQVEHASMQQAEQNLEFTPVPYSSMTRLASIAALAGEDMAKQAGIGDFASSITKGLGGAANGQQGWLSKAGLTSGLGWKLPVAGAALGAGYLAMKGGQSALNYMGQEPGASSWSSGPRLANGVNQYGQPQVGSSFQG